MEGISLKVDEFSADLSFASVTEQHNGNFTCKVSNDVASSEHTAQLRVNGRLIAVHCKSLCCFQCFHTGSSSGTLNITKLVIVIDRLAKWADARKMTKVCLSANASTKVDHRKESVNDHFSIIIIDYNRNCQLKTNCSFLLISASILES